MFKFSFLLYLMLKMKSIQHSIQKINFLFSSSERKVLRDCYMYPARCKLSLTARGARGDQRISVISSTSSNTTSGIVSDRVHSEDEPDTAPASTECLPRLTENTSHSGVQCGVNGSNADVEDRSMPSSPVSTVDGKLISILKIIVLFLYLSCNYWLKLLIIKILTKSWKLKNW